MYPDYIQLVGWVLSVLPLVPVPLVAAVSYFSPKTVWPDGGDGWDRREQAGVAASSYSYKGEK